MAQREYSGAPKKFIHEKIKNKLNFSCQTLFKGTVA
jgi:hypothetical protein